MNAAYLFGLRPPVGFAQAAAAVALNIFVSATYGMFAVYLWSYETPIMQAGALCIFAGLAMFNLTRHGDLPPIAIWDGIHVTTIGLWFAWDTSRQLETTEYAWVPIFTTMVIISYYIVCLRDNLMQERRLRAAEAATVAAQRLDAVSQLAAGLAHDLNNILTASMGHLELAGIEEDPERRAAALRAAHTSSRLAAEHVRQLLHFARKVPLNRRPVDLVPLLGEFSDLARGALGPGQRLVLEVPPSPAPATLDAAQLRSALLNLVLNARDAMPATGTLQIELQQVRLRERRRTVAGETLAAGPYWRIELSDDGDGIDAADQATVFEPFWSTKAPGRGTGLGMSMVKGFAEQSGGGVDLVSQPATGTTVSLYLPADGPADGRMPPAPAGTGGAPF